VEAKAWQALSAMPLLERSGFGLNELLELTSWNLGRSVLRYLFLLDLIAEAVVQVLAPG